MNDFDFMIFWARELVICNSVIDIIRNRKYFTQISPKAFWPPQFTVNLEVIETSTKNNYNKCQKERKEERWKSMVTWQVYLKKKTHLSRYIVLLSKPKAKISIHLYSEQLLECPCHMWKEGLMFQALVYLLSEKIIFHSQ